MKTKFVIYLVIQLIIFSNTSYSQYNARELKRIPGNSGSYSMSYSNSNGEKGISVFEFGEDGKLSGSTWRLMDSSRSSVNYYKYDDDGNIIEKYRVFSDDMTSTETFDYDSDNHLMAENFQRSDGFINSVNYTYNTDGEVIKADWKGYHGWFDGQIIFDYNDVGLVSQGRILQNKAEVGYINFKYDNNERLIEEHWEFSGSYSQTFTYEY